METDDRITVILACLKRDIAGIYVQRKLDELDEETRTVVATTYHKGQMISLTSKPQSRSMMWVFTRELDKESLLN